MTGQALAKPFVHITLARRFSAQKTEALGLCPLPKGLFHPLVSHVHFSTSLSGGLRAHPLLGHFPLLGFWVVSNFFVIMSMADINGFVQMTFSFDAKALSVTQDPFRNHLGPRAFHEG